MSIIGKWYKEFKQTEIGKIPKEWEVVRLGEIFSLEYGKGLTEKERENGEYPVYGSNGVVGYHSQYIVKGPGIIVGRKGTIGAITWSNRNFWPIDTTYYILLKKPETDLKWLFYKLSSLKLAKLNMATGTPGLNRDLVYKLQIPLPPLPEQQKIAEILSTVDAAIEKVDEAIAKTERIKKGLMQELLTKGLPVASATQTGIGHKEFKNTEIGRIPKEWEVVRLGEVFSLEYGKGLTEKERENGEYPVYGSNGVVGYHSQYIVKGPGIIVGRKGTIGAITWSDRNFWPIDTTYYILLKKHKTVLKWLFYKLSSLKLAKLNMATGTPGLNRDLVYKLKLPLPPLPEQKKIAEILSTVDKRLVLLRNKKERLGRVKKGLMNDLLTGKKRVVL